MAVLAIGAIGAAAGATWFTAGALGMSGAALGWHVGVLAGSMLFGPKGQDIYQQGPQLGDLKVQASTYGNPIPIVYGSMRVAGNMIWSADIAKTTHITQSGGGGKGGGGGSVTQESYTYSQSFGIAICEGPIAGVRKIWANGKLIYNISDTADIDTIVASNKSASGIRIYTGSETQTADSLIQAHIGAADTPAYRGVAYVVFENLQLADFGNRTPNIEFEAVTAGAVAHPAGEKVQYAVGNNPWGAAFDSITQSVWAANSNSNTVSKINVRTGARVDYGVINPWGVAFDPITQSVWTANNSAGTASKINIYTGTRVDYAVAAGPFSIVFDSATESVWVAHNSSNLISKLNIHSGARTDYVLGTGGHFGAAFDSVTQSVWTANFSINTVSKVDIKTGVVIDYAAGANPYGVAFDSVTQSVWVVNRGSAFVSKFNVFSGARVDYASVNSADSIVFDPVTQSVWVAGSNVLSKYNITDGTRVDYSLGATSPYGHMTFDSVTNSIWVTRNGSNFIFKINIQDYGLSTTAPTLSSIISNICTRAGLTTGQIDVTALTDSVSGYVVQRGTARSQLEQLMRAFFFDTVESDGKIKFVKRGGASAVSIPEDDLAAHEYGSEPPDTLITTRKQELELPVELNIEYMDTGAAYQIGTQYSQRLITDSENKISLNFAIAMSATKAKQIADVLMYDAWTSRMTFSQSHSWKYSYLEPTDIITVTKSGRNYVMRIVDEDASEGIYARQAVLEDTTIYSQSAAAAGLPAPNESVTTTPLTDLMLLDIPLLRDQDDGIGFYATACGYGPDWKGAQTFKSSDGGATWNSFGDAILNAAAIGVASTVLGDFTQHIFDELNSVTVTMINGELASDTELNVLNGANAALLGNEIIQFKNAALTATNTYLLSGLLRGRHGTEWARSVHAAGDRFVLLTGTTDYLFPGPSVEYDLERKYRGVSFGGFLDDAGTINFTNTAVAQIPYAPVHLGGGRNAAGDLTLSWIRRTRMGGAWNNYSDVQLGEASETYMVEIYNNSSYATVLRTISGLNSPTANYTAAQQTTDFGSTQSVVYWKVYQVSATVGNGYEAKGAT